MADFSHLRDLADAIADADTAAIESFIDTYLSDYPTAADHLRDTARLMAAIDSHDIDSAAASSSISSRFAPVLETYATTLTLMDGGMRADADVDITTLVNRYLLLYRVEHSPLTEQGHASIARRARGDIGAYLHEHHHVDGLQSMLDEAGEVTTIAPHLGELSAAMSARIVSAICRTDQA